MGVGIVSMIFLASSCAICKISLARLRTVISVNVIYSAIDPVIGCPVRPDLETVPGHLACPGFPIP